VFIKHRYIVFVKMNEINLELDNLTEKLQTLKHDGDLSHETCKFLMRLASTFREKVEKFTKGEYDEETRIILFEECKSCLNRVELEKRIISERNKRIEEISNRLDELKEMVKEDEIEND